MDFTFSDEQDALRDTRARASSPTARDARTCGRWSTTSAASPTRSGGDGRARLDGPARARGARAGSASGSSTWSSCSRRWAGSRSRARSSRRRSLATLAARRLGATSCSRQLAAGDARGTVALEELGHGDLVDRVRTRARRKGARLGAQRGEAARARRPHRRLGDRRRAHRGGPRLVPPRGAARERVPDARPDPQGRPPRARRHAGRCRIGPLGDHTAIWRRVVDDAAVAARGGARRRRARQRSQLAVEYAKVRVQFDRPIATFQVIQHKTVDMLHQLELGAGRHALRGVGVRRRRPGAGRGGGDGQGLRRRGRGVRDRGEHPDPRRRRLHLGLRRALLLQAGQAERRAARLPGLAARSASPTSSSAPAYPDVRTCPTSVPSRVVATRSPSTSAAGDVLHLVVGHTRWTAAAREVVRQWWGRDPQFTLVMLSLSSLGALFFRGRPRPTRSITGYSGDTFPNFTPNPWFARRVPSAARSRSSTGRSSRSRSGSRPAARGLPAIVDPLDRGLVDGGERRLRAGRHAVRRGRAARAARARRRAPARAGRRPRPATSRCTRRCSKGVWGALGARRGAIVTVERIVDDLRDRGRTSCASRRTGCSRSCEAPIGAHPGRAATPGALPVDGYGEDYDFWVEARAATRSDDYDDWIQPLGARRRDPGRRGSSGSAPSASRALRAKAEPDSWQADAGARTRPISTRRSNAWERAAAFGRALPRRAGRRARRRRGARGRGRREPLGVARRRSSRAPRARRAAHRRDRAVGLRRRRPPTRSC